MHPAALFTLGVGLSMDAAAVAATRGFLAPRVRVADAARVGLLFGGFQALMPALGWAAGARFAPLIEAWDHWVAFVLLAGLGGKMLYDAATAGRAEPKPVADPFGWRPLVVLAVATSIDALAAGITLPLLDVGFAAAIATIGAIAAVLSAAGVYLGRRFGARLGAKLDAAGGVLLIALGVKTLVEHLRAG